MPRMSKRQYPYDGYGHGTHTMGTLAGAGGIGVAPGAKWIAARIFDSQGSAYDSLDSRRLSVDAWRRAVIPLKRRMC